MSLGAVGGSGGPSGCPPAAAHAGPRRRCCLPSCPAGMYFSHPGGPPRGPPTAEKVWEHNSTFMRIRKSDRPPGPTFLSGGDTGMSAPSRGATPGVHAEARVCSVPDPTGKGVLNHTRDYSVQGSLSYGSPPVAGRPSPGVQPVPPAPESGQRPPHSALQGPCWSRRSVPHEISRQCPRWPGACGLCPGPEFHPDFLEAQGRGKAQGPC